MQMKINVMAALILSLLLTVPNVFVHPTSGVIYPRTGRGSIFEHGLDDGTVMARHGDAAPNYDDCIGDGGNQAAYGSQVGSYCSGLVQGFQSTNAPSQPTQTSSPSNIVQGMTSSPCTDNQTCYNDGFAYSKIHGGLACYAGMGSVVYAGMPTWFYNASTSQQQNFCSGYGGVVYNGVYNASANAQGTAGGVSSQMTAGNVAVKNFSFVAPAGENATNVTTTLQPQTQTTGSFVGQDFGDFHDIPLIGGLVSRHTGLLHNEQGIFVPWTVMCPRVQRFLVEQCSTLINPDGSLTSQGDRAIGCIRNGLAIAVANAHTINLPFGTLRGLLGGLAGATGCGGIVNLNQIQNTDMFQFLLHSVNIGP